MPNYTDVFAPTSANPGGTKQILYFAPLSTFQTIPGPKEPASAANLGELVTISDTFTFKTGGKFYKVELEVNKNELQTEYQGAIRGNRDKFTFTGFLPNLSKKQQGLLRQARNEKHIVLLPMPDNQIVMLGKKWNGAMIAPSFNTGTDEGGERGATIEITTYQYMQIYTGTISFTAAP